MLLLPLLFACSNAHGPAWASGGTRYAEGNAASWGEADSGGGGSSETGDTGYVPEAGAPQLMDAAAVLSTDDLGSTTLSARVTYVDAEDDVVGGNLYADIVSATTYDNGDRDIVGDATFSPDSQAYAKDGVLVFIAFDMSPTLDYQIIVQVRDAAGHLSNTVETTAPAISG